jgi:ribosomal protein L32
MAKRKVISDFSFLTKKNTAICISCDEIKPTHKICMYCVIKIGKQNQQEISDEEIEKAAKEYVLYNDQKRAWVIEGMKLYREQLKSKL